MIDEPHLVLYEPTVSAMVEASRIGGVDAVYAQLHEDTAKLLLRDASRVTVVAENMTGAVRRIASKNGVKLVTANRKWYSNYVYRHFIEPRVKDVLVKQNIDEYLAVLKAEYKTIELIKHTVNNVVPRKTGGFLFAVAPRVPTGDVAVLLYEKYKSPIIIASYRDTGVAWSSIASVQTLRELAYKMSKIGFVDSEVNCNVVSGFILTYPEPPKTFIPLLEDAVKTIETREDDHKQIPRITRAVEIIKNSDNYYSFSRQKAKNVSFHVKTTELNGERYHLIICGESSPFYLSTMSEKVCNVLVYLPLPSKLAVVTRFMPHTMRTNKTEIKATPLGTTYGSLYITPVPREIVIDVKQMIKKFGRASFSIL